MSRYTLPSYDAHLVVTVGWDNPLQTFFAQVIRPATSVDDEDRCVFWVGTEPQELPTVAQLCTHLDPYGAIPGALQDQLTRDQARSLPPTVLQVRMGHLLAHWAQETGA
jgi:hypothetical protein